MEHPASAAEYPEAHHVDSPDITLDNLVGLVEKAARIVDYLQKENAVLADDVKDHQAALQSSAARITMMGTRIQALESEVQQLRRDAQWCRWFQEKYRDSTFFHYIQREYLAAHPDEARDQGADPLAA